MFVFFNFGGKSNILISDVIVRDWNAELKNSQLDVSRLANVAIHVNFIVEHLLVLDNKAFICSVFVAVKLLE